MKALVNRKIKDMKKMALDTGYFYGYGVFETILVREGQPIFLEAHLRRLNAGLLTLGINKSVETSDVEYAIAALRVYNAGLKINVSESNVVFSTRQISYTKEHYENGAKLCLSYVYRNPTSITTNIKSMNYMDNIVEMKRARESGFNDVLFLNYKNEVCETAVANIFAIIDNEIVTPPVSSGLLPGVIRQWLVDEIGVKEQAMTYEELVTSDGVFMTNSLMGIMKVAQIGEHELKEHPLVVELTKRYVNYLKESGE